MLLTVLLLWLLPGREGGRPRGWPGHRLRAAACWCLLRLGSTAQFAGLAEAAGGHLSWTDNPCSRRDTPELAAGMAWL